MTLPDPALSKNQRSSCSRRARGGLVFAVGLVAALLGGRTDAGNCSRCTSGPGFSACNNGFDSGGEGCEISCSSGFCTCYTTGSCGTGGGGNPCRPCQQGFGTAQEAPAETFTLQPTTLEVIGGQSPLLGQLLGALRSRDTGRVYVGPVYNGVVTRRYATESDQASGLDEQPMAFDTFGFRGSTRLENGTLSLDFSLSGHPEFVELHAQLTNAGVAGTVRLVSRDRTTREDNW